MENPNFELGVTDLSRSSGFTKKTYAKLEAGDNLHRVLPPVHSLAKLGRYAQFYAFHGGLKDSKGNGAMYQCIEEKDNKTKIIKTHCPVCDMVRENQARYDVAKKALEAGQAGVSKDQLDKFYNEYIFKYQAQKAFFLNTVNVKGEIVVLQIPYTAYKALDLLLKDLSNKGVDPTGIKGAYLNFKKQQAYKGDKETKYPVDLALEGDLVTGFRPKLHELTQELINQMATKTADLGALYTTITADDMVAILSAQGEDRAKVVDRVFSRGEYSKDKGSNSGPAAMSSQIPGTVATAVSRVEVTPQGVGLVTPDLGAITPGAAPAAAPMTNTPAQLQNLAGLFPNQASPAPAVSLAPQTAPAPAQAAPALAPAGAPAGFNMGQSQVSPGAKDLNDADFMRMFAPKTN